MKQFVRYIAVGVMNTGFSYGVYALGLWSGLDFKAASLLSLVLGILFSFTTQGTLVFRNATRWTLMKFVAAWCALYLFNIAVIGLLLRASIGGYLAGLIATVPTTLVSYFVLKHLVFHRRARPLARATPSA